MVDFFAGLLALGFGFGLASWICSKALDRSNNIGDSHGDCKTYSFETTFTQKCSGVSRSDGMAFFDIHASKKIISDDVDDKALVRRLTQEERKQKARQAPRGAYVSRNTDGYTAGKDKIPEWVKRTDKYF